MHLNIFKESIYKYIIIYMLSSKISLLVLKGVQDKNIENQIITPSIVRIFNKEQNNFRDQGDLMKIKGFITNLENIHKLKKLNLMIMFGDSSYIIPFSFLLTYNNNLREIYNYECKDSNYFIEFPHDILLTHKIPLISMEFSSFTVKIEGLDENMFVDMVLDTYILDIDRRKEVVITENIYNIKIIKEFKIHFIGTDNEPDSFCNYESEITPNFLTQGIIINYPKNKIVSLLITLDNTIKYLDYNNNLINIYGEDIGENLSYFGFNINENFKSNNLIGCVNMSILDKVNVKIKLVDNKLDWSNTPSYLQTLNNDLTIYMVLWNEIKYKMGLCGITYV